MTLLIIFSLLLNLQQVTVPDEKEKVTTTVESATVYLSGAQVSRSAEVTLQAGTNHLVFQNLSTRLSEQSIQIATDKPISILSVRKGIADKMLSSEKLDSLKQLKRELESNIQLKQTEETVLQRELDILISNKDLRGESQNITAEEIRQAMNYFREKLTEIETSRLDLSNAIRKSREELNVIDEQIEEINRQQKQKSGRIIAEIESPGMRTVTLTVSYFLGNAGWYPSYDVRVTDVGQSLSLTYKANIYQNSGIDWENVKLSISSAQPLTSTRIPTVQPVYLRFLQPQNRERFEDIGVSAELQKEMEQAAPTSRDRNIPAPPPVTVTQNQTSFSFNIEQPYSVSGSGEAKTVAMQEHTLDADYRYFAIPKVRPTAYLTAMVTGWEELNLLNGEMNLYFEQTYVGQSQLQANAPGDTLRFSLGQDDRIVLERNRLREFTDKNFFGNRVRETTAWELVVRNTKNRPIELTLIDQIPVSTHEDINIDLEERSGAVLEPNTGELSWDLDIDAEASASRVFRYRVEYPSGKELSQQ